MWKWLLLTVTVLIVGCGNNRSYQAQWPARIVSLEGFSQEQLQAVEGAVEYVNAGAGKQIVHSDDGGTGYPIHLKFVEPDPANTSRAGLAIVESEQCTIELSSIIFVPEKKALRKSIFL